MANNCNKEKTEQWVYEIFDNNNDKKITNDDLIFKKIINQKEENDLAEFTLAEIGKYDLMQKHMEKYDSILDEYVKNTTARLNVNKNLKIAFFTLVITILLAVVGSTLTAIFLLINKLQWESIATIITAIIGLITAIIVLPKIIAEYLFPKGEDKFVLDLIKEINEIDKHYINSLTDTNNKQEE